MKTLSITPLLSLFIVISINLLSPSLSDKPTLDLINNICSSTADFAFCNGILVRNLPTPKADLPALTRLTLSLSYNFAKDTLAFIKNREAVERNPSVVPLWKGCEDNYNRVVPNLRGASEDANKGDYKSMLLLLQLSSKPVIFCQTAIARVVPEMLEKNRLMRVFFTMGIIEANKLL